MRLFWRFMEWQPLVWATRVVAGYMVFLTWIAILGSQFG